MCCNCRSCAAFALAGRVSEAKALLDAINVGGLFDPGQDEDARMAGKALLDVVRKRLADGVEDARRLPAVCDQPGGPSVLR
ncbi:hypothetical protein [Sphingosinicella sp.]|jgi:hypothetical protein|uniref:hypothetical protein n=1 Tax=Sphingosinicella sp. TaxID=1917971 RepID=UPI00185551F7|nr:hypothetical protein [Sphingosinicella sp.]MBA4756828.1 hypothetical protein [Sphingosinicella sp.]MEA3538583.1 hypothetical protein [Pseudomonadota bacterium]